MRSSPSTGRRGRVSRRLACRSRCSSSPDPWIAAPPATPAVSRQRNLAELERSNRRIEEMLGKRPDLIAYPYGESSLEVQEVAKQSGFIAGFGQHSGVIG